MHSSVAHCEAIPLCIPSIPTRKRCSLLGVEIDQAPLEMLVSSAMASIRAELPAQSVACINPHSLMVARSDERFSDALNQADIALPDGVGVTLIGRLLGFAFPERITGFDLFDALMQQLDSKQGGGRVFFLGSTEEVLARIKTKVARAYPNVEVVGTVSPPFGEWEPTAEEQTAAQINATRPDVLWVGMTAPKQEKWVEANRELLDVPVVASIGAVFDFFAETRPRAPSWMIRAGLEWLFRLTIEPKRMWRRNFISTPQFLLAVFRSHVVKAWS